MSLTDMSTGAWRQVIPDEEWAIFRNGGYGTPPPRGVRPALLVVDVTHRFVGLDAPLEVSQGVYPTSTGERAWRAVHRGATVLEAARAAGRPVIYTIRDENRAVQQAQPRRDKHRPVVQEPAEANDVVQPLVPREGECVLGKAKPSAFQGTPLLAMLVYLGVDSLVVIGGVTSGCVRATAVDGFSLGYRVMVPDDAVFDRSNFLHAAHLFDIEQKYGEVCSSDDAAAFLRGLDRSGTSTEVVSHGTAVPVRDSVGA